MGLQSLCLGTLQVGACICLGESWWGVSKQLAEVVLVCTRRVGSCFVGMLYYMPKSMLHHTARACQSGLQALQSVRLTCFPASLPACARAWPSTGMSCEEQIVWF